MCMRVSCSELAIITVDCSQVDRTHSVISKCSFFFLSLCPQKLYSFDAAASKLVSFFPPMNNERNCNYFNVGGTKKKCCWEDLVPLFHTRSALKIQNAGRESVEMGVLLLLRILFFYCPKNEYKAAAFAFEVALRRQIIQRPFFLAGVKNYFLFFWRFSYH